MSVGRRHRRASLEPIERLFRTGTAAGLSDAQLLERFATRHDEAAEAAFAALVDRHGPMVLGVCRRVLNDPNDAHDAFQATFLVLVRKAGAVRRSDSLASWLYGVARRVSAHSRASAMRRRVVEQAAASARPVAWEPGQSAREVWDEVDRLPASLRAAVVLCYLEGLTHEQASARLGWPVGTVRSRLARARDALRSRLTRRGLAPGSALVAVLTPPASALPSLLVEPTVKAAMLVAASDAVEAGLVSVSAASLTQGVLRAMLVTKLKASALAALAAGAVATGTWAVAFQDARPGSPTPGHPGSSSKRLTDREYEAWSRKVNRAYKDKLLKMIESAANLTGMGYLDEAAEQTLQIELTAREWRKALKPSLGETTRVDPTAPGGLPVPRIIPFRGYDDNAVSPEVPPSDKTVPLPDPQPPAAVATTPPPAAPLPPVPPAEGPSSPGLPSNGGIPPEPDMPPTVATLPLPPPLPPSHVAPPSPGASAAPPSAPAPPSPPSPAAEPVPPAIGPDGQFDSTRTYSPRSRPGNPSPDARPNDPTAPRPASRQPAAPQAPAAPRSSDLPPASESGSDRRLDELERKVDRILKALEKNGADRPARQDEQGAAKPVSNLAPTQAAARQLLKAARAHIAKGEYDQARSVAEAVKKLEGVHFGTFDDTPDKVLSSARKRVKDVDASKESSPSAFRTSGGLGP